MTQLWGKNMSNPYGKFITAIDDFENMSQLIIKECEDFLRVSTLVGGEIGAAVTQIAKMTFKSYKSTLPPYAKIALKMTTQYATIGFTAIGHGIGHLYKKSKYKKGCQKILKQGLEYKKLSFELIPESINILTKGIQSYKDCLVEIKAEFLKTINKDDDFESQRQVKVLKNCIRNMYQLEYRLELANKITNYFSQFEKELENNNLEGFSRWYQNEIYVDKIGCYAHCYNEVYDNLLSEITDEAVISKIQQKFDLLNGDTPILTLSNAVCTTRLMEEVSNVVAAEAQNKYYEKTLPSFYYQNEGFNKLKNILTEHFEENVLSKYKKHRNLIFILPSIILTVTYLIVTLNLNDYITVSFLPYFTPLVFVLYIICAIFIVRSKKKKMYEMFFFNCMKNKGYLLIDEIGKISLEYANYEANIKEYDYETLFGINTPLIENQNDEEDALLENIIQSGKIG